MLYHEITAADWVKVHEAKKAGIKPARWPRVLLKKFWGLFSGRRSF